LIVFLLFWKVRTALWCNYFQYRVVQKRHKDYGTIILQSYITGSCGF